MKLKKGDVILSFNTTNLISSAIAEITDSKWSHVMMYVGGGNVIESTVGGVRITPLSHYRTNKYHLKVLRLKNESIIDDVVREVKKLLGVKYGYWQILWFAFLRLIGQSENPKWQIDIEPNGMVCSEAIAWALLKKGLEVKPGYHPAGIEPADFAESELFIHV